MVLNNLIGNSNESFPIKNVSMKLYAATVQAFLLLVLSLHLDVVLGDAPEAEPPSFLKLDFEKLIGPTFDEASKGVVGVSFDKRADNDNEGVFDVRTKNQNTFYSITLGIGSPPQDVILTVDTGSADLWVMDADVDCSSQYSLTKLNCSKYGFFDRSQSSTWHDNKTDFEISYSDSSYARGVWGTDSIRIGNGNIDNFSFAVAESSNSSVAVLGIGLAGIEASYTSNRRLYENLPMRLKRDGFIYKNAYSLYTNSKDASSGSVLFGGVDHNKYKNQLVTLPIVNTSPSQPIPSSLRVTVNGVGVTNDKSNLTLSTSNIPVLLDSGSTFSYFPKFLADAFARSVGATYNVMSGTYICDCSLSRSNIAFVYDFGGLHIKNYVRNFVSPSVSSDVCALLIFFHTSRYIVLGDSFLTDAYVVYDLDDFEISIAQAQYQKSSNIESIVSTIPGAVKAPNYSKTWTFGAPLTTGGDMFQGHSQQSSSTSRLKSGAPANIVNTIAHFVCFLVLVGLILPLM